MAAKKHEQVREYVKGGTHACEVDGCGREFKSGQGLAHGGPMKMCAKHYHRFRRHGLKGIDHERIPSGRRISASLPVDLTQQLDAWCADAGKTPSEAVLLGLQKLFASGAA